MITFDELRRAARDLGVDEQVAELDYAHGWLLWGLDEAAEEAGTRLLLKGGAALGKVYAPGLRTSRDIDVTVREPHAAVVADRLPELMGDAASRAAAASGIRFERPEIRIRKPSAREEVALEARIPFVGPRRSGQRPSKVRVDASTYELVAWPERRRHLHHPFPDSYRAEFWVYAEEEVLAEKIRTVLQRRQVLPKDVVDVWRLWDRLRDHLDRAEFRDRLVRKCEYKGVRYSSEAFAARLHNARLVRDWEPSLRKWMASVPPLDDVRYGAQDERSGERAGGLLDPVAGIGWLTPGGRR